MNQDKLGGIKERIILHRLLGASVGALAVFLLGFTLIPTLISEASAAQDVSAGVNWSPISLTLDPDYGSSAVSGYGDVLFENIIPTSVGSGNLGTQQVVKKTIAVTTSGSTYQVFLSSGSSSSDLVRSGSSGSNSAIDGINASFGAPVSLATDSWGYAVPGNTAFFASLPVEDQLDLSDYTPYDTFLKQNLTKAGIGSAVYGTGLWASTPISTTSPEQIWRAETNNIYGFGTENGDNINNKFDIYYSVMVDTNMLAGEYTNTIVYTAIASSDGLDTASNNISRSLRYGAAGDEETLELQLAMSIPSLTRDQVEVYLVPHSVTEANKDTTTGAYTAIGLGPYSKDSNPKHECIIGNNASDFALANNTLTVKCTIPTNPDPTSTNAGGPTMDGEWDFWVRIEDYGLNYVSQYTENTAEVASFVYAGLQTKKRDGTTAIYTTMQSMTPAVCKNTTAYADNSATTFSLRDTRDSINYNVRKIGDRCWMVSNLRFVGTSLSSSSSDVTSNKTISYGDLTSGDSYTQARIHSGNDGSGNPTVWYNYAATSAMTITGQSNTNEATQSICPKNWKLPSTTEFGIWSGIALKFSLVTGGQYGNGTLSATQYGNWWSSIAQSGTQRRYAYWNGGNGISIATSLDSENTHGFYIRCVARD